MAAEIGGTVSKYDVASDWYDGLGAVLTGKHRNECESDHWLAGWDYGYGLKADSRDALNQYLDSIGMKPMGIVRVI